MKNISVVQTLKDIYILMIEEMDHDFLMEDKNILRIKDLYSLTDCEIRIIAYLLHSYPAPVYQEELMSSIERTDAFPKSVLNDLIEKQFVQVEKDMSFYAMVRLTDSAYTTLSKEDSVVRNTVINDCLEALKKSDLEEIFSCQWMDGFFQAFPLPINHCFREASECLGLDSLTRDMQIAFWVLARHFTRCFVSPLAFRNGEDLLDGIPYSQDVLKYNLSMLVKEGLAQMLPIEPLEESNDTDRFILTPKVVGLLFHGHEELIRYDDISRYANVLKAKDIEEKKLFFSSETLEEIEHLRRIISIEGFERACRILKRQKRNPAVQSLLWGPPGTGKTEIVKQIAKESGRDIIFFDVSKVTASAWGATEKYYRALFRAYNYMAEISDVVPILLLNEADTILSRRLNVMDRAIDKSENAVSNILLQEFEDMSGILLATTNLIGNIDGAFDRRFLFKTQFWKPDTNARYNIWLSAIPDLNESEALKLADDFEMSGAQINNVATKRNLAEIYYDGDRGLSYIEDLCRKEISVEKSEKKPRIGF